MIKKLVVVASGGALAFALAGVANAAMASASLHPAAPPTIRDSIVRGGDPPVITHLNTQTGDPDDGGQFSAAQKSDPDDGGQFTSAQTGDPDDGGQFF
jgi:hypothetical protein